MKYLLLTLLLTIIAGLEFVHVLSDEHVPDANMCMSNDRKVETVRDMLSAHFRNH